MYYVSVYLHIVCFKNSSILLHSSNVGKSLMEGLLIDMGYGKILFEFFRYTKEGWRAVVFEASNI